MAVDYDSQIPPIDDKGLLLTLSFPDDLIRQSIPTKEIALSGGVIIQNPNW